MGSFNPPPPPQESTDVFSLSDQVLSDRLQFIEEIGFGNWGSVWLCRPKSSTDSPAADGLSNVVDQKIAVKLVHRSKTPTTAARVRSLWNEMKIVRTFKSDPHPSIIPFHSFIITPSYALITMAYLPTLVPVEVEETKARDWFRFLLSGVEFLHKRGVVHNDIKPANILLSPKNVPVLVDFGFAEKYDIDSSTAFHSNLSYGTPEYLSPERARGLPHDTRKSDIWSLGITFFEILIGRTPFEHSDGEQFTTKEDLEKYWSRTLRGKWVGSWKMSKDIEHMLRRMVAPNADLRCTAAQAMADPYWQYCKDSATSHRRSSSYTSSVVFEKDLSKLMNTPPRWTAKENIGTPPGLTPTKLNNENLRVPQLTKSKSQPKVAATKVQPRKRAPVPPITDLSPVKASPPSSSFTSVAGKENMTLSNAVTNPATRKPLGALTTRENLPQAQLVPKPSKDTMRDKRRGRVLADLTGNRNIENLDTATGKDAKGKAKEKDRVKERVREWEREKQRLREMAKLEEIEKDRDERIEEAKEIEAWQKKMEIVRDKEREKEKENRRATLLPPIAPSPTLSFFTKGSNKDSADSPPPSANDSLNIFRHNIRKSIDKTVQLYKSSAIAQVAGKPTLSVDAKDDTESRKSESERESWEDEALIRDAKSSLPVVRHAVHNERIAADARMDRMTIWMHNVEKVVEDARQNFASSSTHQLAHLPPLPLAPLSRSTSQNRTNRSSRLPRKVLAASQIFSDENDRSVMEYTSTPNISDACATTNNTTTDSAVFSGRQDLVIPEIHTPSRQRRATVSTRSPEPAPLDMDTGSPSKRREKSKSHGNLFQLHIAPVSLLEAELNKPDVPVSSSRLSQVLDSSLFISTPTVAREHHSDMPDISEAQERSFNDLTSSPFHVEPYPSRRTSAQDIQIPDTPSQRRIEGVYDRFLMATSGVKRLGKGYQSDNTGPICHTVGHNIPNHKRDNGQIFHSVRRAMPPPVSSDDQRRAVSVDELGVITYAAPESSSPAFKDDSNTTVALVRRAFKAIVPGKTTSRRLSRIA